MLLLLTYDPYNTSHFSFSITKVKDWSWYTITGDSEATTTLERRYKDLSPVQCNNCTPAAFSFGEAWHSVCVSTQQNKVELEQKRGFWQNGVTKIVTIEPVKTLICFLHLPTSLSLMTRSGLRAAPTWAFVYGNSTLGFSMPPRPPPKKIISLCYLPLLALFTKQVCWPFPLNVGSGR